MRLVMMLLVLIVLAGPAHAISRKKQCLQACGGLIAACARNVVDRGLGTLQDPCRRAVLQRCKREGPTVCDAFCGNGAVGAGESCDGTDLGGRSCASLGFLGGTLGCTAGCTFDTTACVVGAFPATGQTTSVTPGDDGALRRGGTLRYTDNGDGTITDANTGLVWEKKSSESGPHFHDNHFVWAPGAGSVWEWITIVNAENGSGFAGHSDWRIPNLRELQSLVDYENSGPAVAGELDTGCTPGCTVTTCSCTEAAPVWTSTTFAADPALAWFVDFANGFAGNDVKSAPWHVRAVRGP